MKNYIITIAIAVVVFVVGMSFLKTAPVETAANLGSASSPSVNGACMDVNGVVTCSTGRPSGRATTTPCAVLSPSATSTLVRASFTVSSTSASAAFVEFGKSTTAFATTTTLGSVALGAGAQGYIVASSTATSAAIDAPYVFAPSTYLVTKVGGAAPTQLAGTCQAVFQSI